MPLDPVEIEARLRRGYAAFSEGDFDEAVTLVSDDFEFARTGVESPLRGPDAFRQWMEPDAFEIMQIAILEVRVAGEKALIEQRTRARGAGSGMELNLRTWGVWTMGEDGRAVRAEVFLEHERDAALQAWGG